jgi:hypothetical protein
MCRHLIVTGGERVALDAARARVEKLVKAVRRLNDRMWFSEHAEVVLRVTEIAADSDCHCHIHLIIRSHDELSKRDWIRLTAQLTKHFAAVVLDDGPVRNPHGIAGYLFKGHDTDELDEDAQLRFVEQMVGARTHEPLGSFRSLWREIRKTKNDIVRNGKELVLVKRADGSRKQNDEKENDPLDGRAQTPATPPPLLNYIRAITRPMPHVTRVYEPTILTLNYDGNFSALLRTNPNLAAYRNELMPQWVAGLKEAGITADVLQYMQIADRLHDLEDDMETQGLSHFTGINLADFLNTRLEAPPVWKTDPENFPI